VAALSENGLGERKPRAIPWQVWLLCAPSWTLVPFYIVMAVAAKINAHWARTLLIRPVLLGVAVVLMASPFFWLAAVVTIYAMHRANMGRLRNAWMVVAASGVAFVASWMVVGYFAQR